MRLRNVVVVSVVLLASGGLALEFAARSAALRLARVLEPAASLSYESAGIALDGSIRLSSPSLQFNRGLWKSRVRARVANLRGPGRFWLVGQALSGDPEWPDDMSLQTLGLTIEETDDPLVSNWVSIPDFALFENLGCGSDALSSKDRVRMGVNGVERVDRFGYQYDDSSKRLELSMTLDSEEIARWIGTAELTGFDPSRWSEGAKQPDLRLGRATLSYQDPGYLPRRNKFCAEWLGITPAQFVDRHLAAARTFLATRGIEPSEDVLDLYQRVVNRGGALNLASLPDASWVPSETDAYPRQVLLRLLNITVRIDDAPPMMLRLAFSEPEEPLYAATSEQPDPALVEILNGTESAQVVDSEPAEVEATVVAEPAPAETVAEVVAAPVAAEQEPEVVANAGEDPALPPIEESDPEPPRIPGLGASAPPPPENSTLALVWKPGQIERLPPREDKPRNYDVIATASLGSHIGKRVQLLTAGGKRVDGEVQSTGSGNLVLLVQVGRGSAELNVPLENIREARLMRSQSSGSR